MKSLLRALPLVPALVRLAFTIAPNFDSKQERKAFVTLLKDAVKDGRITDSEWMKIGHRAGVFRKVTEGNDG